MKATRRRGCTRKLDFLRTVDKIDALVRQGAYSAQGSVGIPSRMAFEFSEALVSLEEQLVDNMRSYVNK